MPTCLAKIIIHSSFEKLTNVISELLTVICNSFFPKNISIFLVLKEALISFADYSKGSLMIIIAQRVAMILIKLQTLSARPLQGERGGSEYTLYEILD